MEDSLDVAETDDSLNIAAKDWNRTIEIAKKVLFIYILIHIPCYKCSY